MRVIINCLALLVSHFLNSSSTVIYHLGHISRSLVTDGLDSHASDISMLVLELTDATTGCVSLASSSIIYAVCSSSLMSPTTSWL